MISLKFESEQTIRIPFISCYGFKCEYHNSFNETKGTRKKKMWKIPHLGGGPDRVIFHTFFSKKKLKKTWSKMASIAF